MWIIYKHTNKINGKSYIGQTCQEATERWGSNGCNYDVTFKFGKAIRKYGWDNFEHSIIEHNIATQQLANEREMYYIELYDSYKHGYNMTKGGSGFCADRSGIGIYQVDKDKKIIAHFSSITDAAHSIGCCAQNIGSCLLGTQLTCFGYYFFEDTIDITNIVLPKSKYNRPIICVETGVVYNSIKEASTSCGVCRTSLTKCCSRQAIVVGGYHWAYLDEYGDDWTAPILSTKENGEWRRRKILCVETGDVWESIVDCSIETGIRAQNLSKVCKDHQTAKGKHYAYLDDYGDLWKPAEPYNANRRAQCSTRKKEVYCLQTNRFYKSATECANELGIPIQCVSKCAKGESTQTHGYNFCYTENWYKGWLPQKLPVKHASKKPFKPVLCVETSQVYKSISDAERCTGVQASSIGRVCNHKNHCNTAGSYHWKYINEENNTK